MANDPVTQEAVLECLRTFAEGLSTSDTQAMLSGQLQLTLGPAVSAQRPSPPAILLAAAVDSGDAADLAAAVRAMRAQGWADLAADVAAAFAHRIQRGSSGEGDQCACGHAAAFHTPELGCWLCTCVVGAVA